MYRSPLFRLLISRRAIRPFSTSDRWQLFRKKAIYREDGQVFVQRVRFVKSSIKDRVKANGWWIVLGSVSYILLRNKLDKILDEEEDAEQKKNVGQAVKQTIDKAQTIKDGEKIGAGPGRPDETGRDNRPEVNTEVSAEDVVPETQPEDATFIPLGWAKQTPQIFYSGSDPEWQAFVAFAKDKKRGEIVRKELAGLVTSHVSDVRTFQRFLGSPIKQRRAWLDIDFPDGPPPGYERAGLEITDDYVAFVSRPVDPLNVSRLNSALFPLATASATWTTFSTLLQFQYAKVKNLLNLDTDNAVKGKPKFPPGFEGVMNLKHPNGALPPGTDVKDLSIKEPELETKSSKPSSSKNTPWVLRPLVDLPTPGEDVTSVSSVLKQSLVRNWKHASAPPPRGTFMVSGLVELIGPKGTCVLDVRGAYDPRISRWAVVGIAVRRVQARQQTPKGGP